MDRNDVAAPSQDTDLPPPSYANALNSSPIIPFAVPNSPPFPAASFNVYNMGDGFYHLGEHQDQPLYAITFYMQRYGKSHMTLHNGPISQPALATAVEDDIPAGVTGLEALRLNYGKPSIITTLIPEGSGSRCLAEKLLYDSHKGEKGGKPTFSFGAPVGQSGQNVRIEQFEWRQSKGDEVRSLRGKRQGWKLVSLNNNQSNETGTARTTAGERDVVAAWTPHSGSLTKIALFRFIGKGVTGELGDYWALMAVTTMLRILQLQEGLNSGGRESIM